MTALVGAPLRIGLRLEGLNGGRRGGGADYEIHHPAPGTELVVCGDCGFTFDADQTVTDDAGRVGYECPRCVLALFVEARQRVIEATVREGVAELAKTMRRDVAQVNQELRATKGYLATLRAERDALRRRADEALDQLGKANAKLRGRP